VHALIAYGGALPLSPASTPMAARIDLARERKNALARAGATLVERGELVFLDCTSTNLALVQLLPADYGLTIATNAIAIAAEVVKRRDLLIVLGGLVDQHVGGCVDADRDQRLRPGRRRVQACAAGLGPQQRRHGHQRQARHARAAILKATPMS
jgi:DeoR/GlpR family transcriptional regulator of sugar metabolism